MNLIVDPVKLTLTNFNSDKDNLLYTVLKQFNPKETFPCGLEGSVDDRIKDCSYQLNSKKEGFVLVTRSKDFKEVYKETSTGLLWSDRLPYSLGYKSASSSCNSSLKEVAGISGVTWRLPSINEYKEAEENGIRNALPNMNYWFWSSSRDSGNSYFVLTFSGDNGDTLAMGYDIGWMSVRCVALDY